MRFLILAACLALAAADGGGGGDHHHHHEPSSEYAEPASPTYGAPAAPAPAYGAPAPAAPTYGAPAAPAYNAPVADSYGAPQEAPVYAPPQQEYAQETYGAPAQESYGAPAQEGYGAPAQETYGAPAQEYAQETYGAPEAAAPEYNAPTTYEAATETLADMMDMSKLLAVLPLLVAVGAAILVAQIFAPLLGGLFGLKAASIAGFVAPLGNLKVGLLNALLAPTGLAICNTTPVLAIHPGRESASGFEFDQDKVDLVANMMYNAIKSKSLFLAIPTS